MSGGSGGGGSRGNGATAGPIPAMSRKLVQSVKEIVNCPESEIYSMLKECNMDPNEAVHRLLSQDTFHEVKSKRDKKKEIKDTPESRSRAVNSSGRGARGGIDRTGRNSSMQSSLSDYGVTRGKPVNKKENGTIGLPTSSILGSSMVASNPNRRPTISSDSVSMESTMQGTGLSEGIPAPLQAPSGFQHNWFGKPGHVSMADIVKMGRPQGKPSNAPIVASDRSSTTQNAAMSHTSHQSVKQPPTTVLPSESDQKVHSSQNPVAQVTETGNVIGVADGQHISHEDWSLVDEPPAGSGSIVPETSDTSAVYADLSASSTLLVDGVLHGNPHLDEIEILEGNVNSGGLPAEPIRSTAVSDRHIQLDDSGESSHLNDGLLKNMNSYQTQRHAFEEHEVEDDSAELSSAAADLRQLSLHTEERGAKSAEDNPAVIIPDHLQVTNADCAHLSFGSFGSGAFSGSFPSKTLKSNLEVAPVAETASSIDQPDARNHEYYNNGQLISTSNEDVVAKTVTNTGNLDMPSASQPEVIRNDALDATHGLQYNFPSASGYAFSSTSQPNEVAYTYPQGNTQMQNLSSLSNLMMERCLLSNLSNVFDAFLSGEFLLGILQIARMFRGKKVLKAKWQKFTIHCSAFKDLIVQPNSLPSSLLATTVPPLRDFDLPFSSLLTTQSMPAKFNTAVASISGPTISMPEAGKQGVFSNPQSTPQTLSGTTLPSGPTLPQHLPVHHYTQPTLPLSHFANMISFPFLPQSYTYLPSAAFQQPYTGNGPFHQSPAAVPNAGIKYTLPQYKSSVSVTSLPQSASVASAYGGLGSSANLPGSFTLNPTTASASTTIGLEEALSSQYKEANHYMPLQQADNPAMWVHGAGSRTMSALPASTFYSFQGQNQHSGYRQGQQPSQFGALGYPNFYPSQAGVSQEHQQNPSEGNLTASQAAPSQPSHQMWQHGY
ncbi:signaling mucin HKR1 [Cocos nucifera]|uniref:Signaling mucin HKR1 n=1 Tax=Cocos nucifera TaxID=13894 RepID=A0A8K0IUI5_COCNU|nr:signaling mucin HKR1 [Cocos nucifera]